MITGTEDRQHAYVALSRGTEVNLAYVFTASPKTADPAPGPRPAPELARYDRRAITHGGPAAPAAPAALCVPKTSSTSCDQAVFVDQATGVSLPSDAVPVEIDRFG